MHRWKPVRSPEPCYLPRRVKGVETVKALWASVTGRSAVCKSNSTACFLSTGHLRSSDMEGRQLAKKGTATRVPIHLIQYSIL